MLERINPHTTDSVSLTDHYSRYLFAAQFIKGKRVLDAACGTGYGSYFLKEMGASHVTGIDISEEAIDFARSNYPNVDLEFISGDIQFLDELIDGRSYDVVVSFETLEHIPEPEKFVGVVAGVLGTHGIFISSVPDDIGNGVNNPFHKKKFMLDEYHGMLKHDFAFMESFTQYLSFGAQIQHDKTQKRHRSNSSGYFFEDFSGRSMVVEKNINCINKFCFLAVCGHSKIDLEPVSDVLVHSVGGWFEYSANVKKYENDLIMESSRLRLECKRLEGIISDLDAKRVQEYEALYSEMRRMESEFLLRESNLISEYKMTASRK